jgi:hypothetical protein
VAKGDGIAQIESTIAEIESTPELDRAAPAEDAPRSQQVRDLSE